MLQEDDFLEILVSLDFVNHKNNALLSLPGGEFGRPNHAGTDFPSFEFNQDTYFVFCADPANLDVSAYCEILNLQTWYTYYDQDGAPFYLADLYRKLFFLALLYQAKLCYKHIIL